MPPLQIRLPNADTTIICLLTEAINSEVCNFNLWCAVLI